jgi:hypothetical protein
MMPLTFRASLAALGVALFCFVAAGHCAVFNVDTTADDPSLTACDDATPNDCSLRGAIIRANGLTEGVIINLPAGTYILSQATPCSFRGNAIGPLLTSQALCPVGTLDILGAGSAATIIDANQPPGSIGAQAPIMFVATTASVRIRGVTMQHGNFSVGSLIGHGGAINNAGTLVIEDSLVTDNFTIGAGGGIFNQRDLTILRSTVTRNISFGGGGGIVNTNLLGTCQAVSPCHDGQGLLTIADSTVSENFTSNCCGAGIFNFDGMIDITNSTISGNSTNASGGGISNSAWNVNLTNVTVSGNHARTGGGIAAGGAASTMHLNNVTVVDNTAQDVSDPSFGLAGGVLNGAAGTVTAANTIIARNVAAGVCTINGCFPGANDCSTDAAHGGPLTSQGHNLIQDTQGCEIVGDTTGNITGQDAKLGVLTDNGGHAFTHALAPNSPAVDAGNPATPGSGGAACAVTDERAFLRPIGPRCDIGAFERSGVFSIADIVPGSGGNTGQATAHLGGGGFVDGVTVRLRRSGHSDIVGAGTRVDVGGASIATTFDLTGAAPGIWDVIVTNPDSTSVTLSSAFTVRAGVGPNVWVDVVGIIRRHGPSTIWITYGNRGDSDAIGVPLSLSLPNGYQWARFFNVTPPPPQPGEFRPDWSLFSEAVGLAGRPDFLNAPLFLPLVPSGFSSVLRLDFTLPVNATDTVMFAAAGDPVVTQQTESAFIGQAVAGAQAFATQGFGVPVPASVVSQLQQYATTQLHAMIANGQAAFAASLGTAPQIYSLDQYQVDLFLFIVPRVPPVMSTAGR